MTLTLGGGPISHHPPADVNYRIDGPAQCLLFGDFPRRIRAVLDGETVADTTRGRLLHESGLLPVLYVPDDDVRLDLLERTDHTTHCPFKGDANYYSAHTPSRVAKNAAWSYREPFDAARWLRGYVAFDWNSMDQWLDEDEEVRGHLRDPYHRVDTRRSSRHVRILAGGEIIADTKQPKLLSETGLPNRLYLPAADVRRGFLERSDTRTVCPYKGTATYWSLRLGGKRLDDAAWSYDEPLEDAEKVGGHICFLHDEIQVQENDERLAH